MPAAVSLRVILPLLRFNNHAIDRNALRDRVMKGLSYPTGQLVPEGFGGYAPDIPVPQYDPERSRKLLAEAGWPKGFRIKMHCMDQFGALCQALAQMFTRVGIRVELEVMPRPAYWPKMNDLNGGSGSLYISSWGASSSGEANLLETSFTASTRSAMPEAGT